MTPPRFISRPTRLLTMFGVITAMALSGATAYISPAHAATNSVSNTAFIDGAATYCSGTLISQHHVLTARHCLAAGPANTVSFGDEINHSRTHAVVDQAIHDEADIAVLTLDQPVTYVTPAPINTTQQFQGDDFYVTGFNGRSAHGSQAVTRTGFMMDERWLDEFGLVITGIYDATFSNGDSGAGIKDGNGAVIGVHDFSYDQRHDIGGGASMYRYGAWVIGQINKPITPEVSQPAEKLPTTPRGSLSS